MEGAAEPLNRPPSRRQGRPGRSINFEAVGFLRLVFHLSCIFSWIRWLESQKTAPKTRPFSSYDRPPGRRIGRSAMDWADRSPAEPDEPFSSKSGRIVVYLAILAFPVYLVVPGGWNAIYSPSKVAENEAVRLME